MSWSGAAILAVIVLGIVYAMRAGDKILAQQQARIDSATPAQATVVDLGRSNIQPHQDTITVRLFLEVQSNYRPPYRVHSVWNVDAAHIPQIQPGATVAVKIDQSDQQLVFPNVSWARFDWTLSQHTPGQA